MKSLLLTGPFEQAHIRARKFTERMYRTYVFQDLLEQLNLAEEALEEADDEISRKMAEMVIEQLESNLEYMLTPPGAQNDNEKTISKIPRTTL